MFDKEFLNKEKDAWLSAFSDAVEHMVDVTHITINNWIRNQPPVSQDVDLELGDTYESSDAYEGDNPTVDNDVGFDYDIFAKEANESDEEHSALSTNPMQVLQNSNDNLLKARTNASSIASSTDSESDEESPHISL